LRKGERKERKQISKGESPYIGRRKWKPLENDLSQRRREVLFRIKSR
jgi:hypothetical protein